VDLPLHNMAVATFEATEAAASVVFTTLASVKTLVSTSWILNMSLTIILWYLIIVTATAQAVPSSADACLHWPNHMKTDHNFQKTKFYFKTFIVQTPACGIMDVTDDSSIM